MSNILVGRRVLAVQMASDKKAIRFDTDKGEVIARMDGDCCSSTWVEGIEGYDALIGEEVLTAEDIEMPDLGSPDEYDVIAYYGFKITTRKGTCVIDYRNESNGYYGGNISWPEPEGKYEYFYGGVHDQNVSDNDWKELQHFDTA